MGIVQARDMKIFSVRRPTDGPFQITHHLNGLVSPSFADFSPLLYLKFVSTARDKARNRFDILSNTVQRKHAVVLLSFAFKIDSLTRQLTTVFVSHPHPSSKTF